MPVAESCELQRLMSWQVVDEGPILHMLSAVFFFFGEGSDSTKATKTQKF